MKVLSKRKFNLRLFFLLPAILVIACNTKVKEAKKFNEDMAAKETALSPQIQACETHVKEYYASRQFDKIVSEGRKMELALQRTIDELETMPTPKLKGAKEFKAAYIKSFQYAKGIYIIYQDLGQAAGGEEMSRVIDRLNDQIKRKTDVLSELRKAQEEFARANGYRVGD